MKRQVTPPLRRVQRSTGRQRSSAAITRGGPAVSPAATGITRTTHAPFSRSPAGVTRNARVAPGHMSAPEGSAYASGIVSGSNATG